MIIAQLTDQQFVDLVRHFVDLPPLYAATRAVAGFTRYTKDSAASPIRPVDGARVRATPLVNCTIAAFASALRANQGVPLENNRENGLRRTY